MPKFIVCAGTFSHYYTIPEHFIIKLQIKILVEMIHHFIEPDFYFVFLFFPFPHSSSLVYTYLYFITFPTAIN